jgi:hypothetical protein
MRRAILALTIPAPIKTKCSPSLIQGIVRFFGARGLQPHLSWGLLGIWGF